MHHYRIGCPERYNRAIVEKARLIDANLHPLWTYLQNGIVANGKTVPCDVEQF